MKQLLFIIIFITYCVTAFCQAGVLTGNVIDAQSKTPLELATIGIFGEDSSLIKYQLSDKNGKFLFDKLPVKKKVLVSVTYTGYAGQRTSIMLDGGKPDTLNVLMSFDTTDTNAVVVKATIPIRMNGDTLEINPAAFKMKQEAVVEELLNQLPGITIWSDGTITVDGKKVQNLLVDGKPFLGSSDTRVATQNLPKAAIDKIQLYQEYDRSNINQTSPSPQDSTLTMNIKLKENSKKGYFGKAGFGYGTTDRFESDLSLQVYNKRSSGGIGGGMNNINKNIGNLQEMFQNNTYRNYNPNLYNVGRFGTNGINKNHSIGGVYSHSFIETANSRQNNRITINYNKAGTDAYVTDLNLQNRTTINNPEFIREEGVQNNVNDRNDIGINYVKTNSYNDNLNINGSMNTSQDKGNSTRYTEVRDSSGQLQSTDRSTSVQNRRSDNESMNFNYSKADRDDPLKSFSAQFDVRRGNSTSERDVRSNFQSMVDATKNTAYNRLYANNNNSLNLGGSLEYSGIKRLLFGRFNLFGINMNLSQRVSYAKSSDNSKVNDFDSTAKEYMINSKLSNENERALFEYTPSLSLSKYFSKYNDVFFRSVNLQLRLMEEIKTDENSSTIAQRNKDRSFQFFRYEGSVGYQYQKQRKYMYYLSANYTKNFDYPSIDQLYTVVDDINVYNTRIGNPLLRNRINHNINLNLNFNTQKPDAIYAVNGRIGGGFTRSLNPVVDSIINDPSGRRISYFINADKSSNLSANYAINISRKLKKNSVQLMYDGRFNTGKAPNYVDGLYNVSETENLYNNFTLQFTLKSVLVLTAGKSLQYYKSNQTAAGLRSFKNDNNTTRLGVVLNYPENFTFSSTMDRVANSNIDKPTMLWNAFAGYRFMKQQAELKFSAMDILKQYKNISNSATAYGTSTRISNSLQQYYLLTLSYYPRKFGKTAGRRD